MWVHIRRKRIMLTCLMVLFVVVVARLQLRVAKTVKKIIKSETVF